MQKCYLCGVRPSHNNQVAGRRKIKSRRSLLRKCEFHKGISGGQGHLEVKFTVSIRDEIMPITLKKLTTSHRDDVQTDRLSYSIMQYNAH
jgi:hypothetical protein